MNRYFILFFVLISCFSIRSQSGYFSLTGTILDKENKPVPVGNAIALSIKDSSILKGEAFLDGKLKLDGLSESKFLLKITSVGFRENILVITRQSADSIVDAGTVVLSPNTDLNEVEIIAKVPLFEKDAEKTKVNVENTVLSTSGTVMDVLRKSPGLRVDQSDNVSVFGKGIAIIYLDGQLLPSNEVLKSIPSTDIKHIDIISNPSAKYDANGRAVINIITKKNNLTGFTGNVIQNTMYGKYLISYSNIRLQYKNKKWLMFAGYGFNTGKTWSSDHYTRQFSDTSNSKVYMDNRIEQVTKLTSPHNYRAGITYTPDTLNSFSLQYNGFYQVNDVLNTNINDISQNNLLQFALQTSTKGRPILMNNSAALNYTRKLDTSGSDLTTTFQLADFVSDNLQNILQNSSFGTVSTEQNKRNVSHTHIQIFTAQSDLNKAISKNWKVELGLKNSYIPKTSKINFDNYSSTGEWVSDSAYFNGFNYDENVFAAYAQLRYQKNKLSARAGLRGEQTNANGFSYVQNKKVIDRNYFNVFPSAFVGYDFTKDLNFGLVYSSRIRRPTYQDMDPFINYIDSLTSMRGNPYLLPEYTNAFEATLTYLKEASIGFEYSRTKGALNLVAEKLNNGTDAFIGITKNLDYSETFSYNIALPYELKWWTTYNAFGYAINNFAYKQNGVNVINKRPMFYIYLYDEFRFKKILSMEITYQYTSAGVDGIFTYNPFYTLSANIKKTFLKDKLTVRFIANDILSSFKEWGGSNIPGVDITYLSKYNTHYYMLSMNYQFGKLKSPGYKDRSVNQDEFQRIKMGGK